MDGERQGKLDPERIAYRMAEAARAAGVSYTTLRDWIVRGIVPTVVIGHTRRVLREDLEAVLRDNRQVTYDPLTRQGRRPAPSKTPDESLGDEIPQF
jgi:excisionase family DNA binding protein